MDLLLQWSRSPSTLNEEIYASRYPLGLLPRLQQINADTETIVQIVQYKGNHSLYSYSWTSEELADRLNSSVDALFFEDACPQENCTAVCDGDFATMFQVNGLHTLHNCMLAPNLAVATLVPVNEAFLKDRYTLGSALNVTAKNVVYRVNGKPCRVEICGPS